MLKSPSYVVVGAANIERTARFFQTVGFVQEASSTIDAFAARELYGLHRATNEVRLTMPGAAAGFVRLVETSEDPATGGPLDHGPHAVDLYVRDMGQALDVVKNTHADIGAVAAYSVGPMAIKECKCVGPDGLALVLIEVDRRRPSRLDSSPAVLFSEIHSAVYVVDSIDAAGGFWKDAGLKVLLDATFAEPGVAEFMHLPRPDTRLRLALFADEGADPVRLELIEFPDPDGRGAPRISARPLRPGRFIFGFEVADAAVTGRSLPAAVWSKTCRTGLDLVTAGLAPQGVGFEVRSSRSR
jgi:catechol 2,3-dioxygenase-like lactoylglutathione lyase family enzyme